MATQSLAFTFIYACYLLSGRRSDVGAPRKCAYKKQRRLPKGLRSFSTAFTLAGVCVRVCVCVCGGGGGGKA